ncbi:MAG TPA: inositol monophosphatase family protein [Methyloceanibacter sp.]|nr:inositol monophosphatase family protein [Methyloceanibacter sp.]
MATSALMNVMLAAARKAGRSLARDFGEVEQLQVSLKGPANFVTAADHRAEEILHGELTRARPGYGLLMEERGEVEGADRTHRWIVDPLDGTTNFLHGIPIFAVSIALERDGDLVAGLIFNPVTHETFTAERGKGAFFNDRRLRVSARTELEDCVIGTGIPHSGRPGHPVFLRELEAVMTTCAGVRRCGAAALDLAWVAAGRFDGFWERNLRAWDIAAGIVILREAGGYVSDTDGKDLMLKSGNIVAGNEAIHRKLLKLLKNAGAAPSEATPRSAAS